MATFTLNLAVGTVEHILGTLAVVKVPQLPGSGVVAVGAIHAKFLCVLVFFFMTGITVAGSILEAWCRMTTGTCSHNVPPSEREPCQRMVEFAHFPAAVAVTRFASFA